MGGHLLECGTEINRLVKLRANVEGDIFHRSLSIDESSVFEGASRRVEDPVERRAVSTAESSSAASRPRRKKAHTARRWSRPRDRPLTMRCRRIKNWDQRFGLGVLGEPSASSAILAGARS